MTAQDSASAPLFVHRWEAALFLVGCAAEAASLGMLPLFSWEHASLRWWLSGSLALFGSLMVGLVGVWIVKRDFGRVLSREGWASVQARSGWRNLREAVARLKG
jgi:hypothetical protein